MSRRLGCMLAATVTPLLVIVVLLRQPAQAGGNTPLLIDAVLYDGYENGDADEAVRLRNVSELPLDIGGWQLNDGEASTAVISGSVILNPQEAIWLAKYGDAFARQFGFLPDFERYDTLPTVEDLAGSWPSLSNSGDQVILLDEGGMAIDCLAYESDSGADCGPQWSGTAVSPYGAGFGAEGQILYRRLDQATGLPVPDSNTAHDWAQGTHDVINGRKVQYPGWDLEQFFQTAKITETAVITVAIAPDNAYRAVIGQIESAQTSIRIEVQTFENIGIAQALLAALRRGVSVDILLEGEPVGGISDQEIYICQLLATEGGNCYFMFNEDDLKIYDRYTYIHAKFILIDEARLLVSSENLSPNSMPDDDKSDGTLGRRGVVLITDAPGVISHVQAVFDRDLDLLDHQDISDTQILEALPPNFVPLTLTGGISYPVTFPSPAVFSGTFAFEVVQSPENSLRDSDSLLGMVNRAGAGDVVLVQQLAERPYWGSSTSNAVADPNPRLQAYIDAARRGARVRLLLDSLFDSGNATSNTATCDYVNIIADGERLDLRCQTGNPTGLGIHNKMVLVQAHGRGYLHLGSINGTEQSSKGNRELALQIQSDEIYHYLAGMFWQDSGFTLYLPIGFNNYILPAPHLLISEVLYDPFGAADDNEFIEIVNPTYNTIDLSHYSIGDAAVWTDFEDVRRFPEGTLLAPGQLLVIATTATAFFAEYNFQPDFEILNTDDSVPDLIDDLNWGDPATFLRLGNQGDELFLRDSNDYVVDVLVYGSGTAAGVTACSLVTQPHASLERFPYWRDTDDCTFDFREWPFPNPGTLP